MIETEAQSLIVHAVEAHGGKALKLSNRFMTGVADLLVKLPHTPAMVLECKLHTFSVKTIKDGHSFDDIGCTGPQKKFLRDWHAAGMRAGVVSFVQEHGVGLRTLRMTIYDYELMEKIGWCGDTYDHGLLGNKSDRFGEIFNQLTNFAEWLDNMEKK